MPVFTLNNTTRHRVGHTLNLALHQFQEANHVIENSTLGGEEKDQLLKDIEQLNVLTLAIKGRLDDCKDTDSSAHP